MGECFFFSLFAVAGGHAVNSNSYGNIFKYKLNRRVREQAV